MKYFMILAMLGLCGCVSTRAFEKLQAKVELQSEIMYETAWAKKTGSTVKHFFINENETNEDIYEFRNMVAFAETLGWKQHLDEVGIPIADVSGWLVNHGGAFCCGEPEKATYEGNKKWLGMKTGYYVVMTFDGKS